MSDPTGNPPAQGWNQPPNNAPYGNQPPAGGSPYNSPPPWQGSQTPQQHGGVGGHGSGSMSPSEERTWGMAAHLGSFVAAWLALGFLAPLLVLLVKGNDSPFVRRHAVESLNFQILTSALFLIGGIASVVTLGVALLAVVPLAVIWGVYYLVAVIRAGMRANNGGEYRYAVNLRMVS